MKKNLIILGTGGHAKSCLDVVESTNNFNKIIFIDNNKSKNFFLNYNVYNEKKIDIKLKKFSKFVLIGIGMIKNLHLRENLFKKYKKMGFVFPIIKSSKSYVSKNAKIEEGTIVMHGAVINSGANIGKNCIINSGSIIEHDCIVEDNCHISTKVVLNGNVTIKKNCFIGSNSTISNNVTIKKNTFIKLASKIKKNN